MKVRYLLSALCANMIPVAAFAHRLHWHHHPEGAPAPLIGTGLPVAVMAGSVLLAFAIWQRVSARA